MVDNYDARHHITKSLIMHDYPDERQPRSISGRPEHRVIRVSALCQTSMTVRHSLVQGIGGTGDAQECFWTVNWLLSSRKRYGADGERRVSVRILLVYETEKKLCEVLEEDWNSGRAKNKGP